MEKSIKRDLIIVGNFILNYSDFWGCDIKRLKEDIQSPLYKWIIEEIYEIKLEDENADIVKISNILIEKYHGYLSNDSIRFRGLINDCVFSFLAFDEERKAGLLNMKLNNEDVKSIRREIKRLTEILNEKKNV